jgi:pyridoxamine 5'-phosphate oxidase
MSPTDTVRSWLEEARRSEPGDADALQLATAGADGRPSVRTVLVRDVCEDGWTFFTGYGSRKAVQLAEQPWAAGVFCWKTLARQVHVEGPVRRAPDDVSDAYFAHRPRGSQVGAWASRQSHTLASRAALDAAVAEVEARFAGVPVPRPPDWGGFVLQPARIELWQGRPDRLHERTLWERGRDGHWTAGLLWP